MDIVSSLAIVIFAALIHASFQLSVSVLTLMSGHAIGSKRSHTNLLKLTNGFLLGAAVMTTLLLSTTAFTVTQLFGNEVPLLAWAVAGGLLVGIGISVWAFYYRREKGTVLWLPRTFAGFLSERSKHTKNTGEAFGLGLTSVFAELLFILGPIFISSLALVYLPSSWQLFGVALYTVISLLSLLVIGGMIGSGHTLGGIQKWRENNKHFLQFTAGSGLLVLGVYVFVEHVLTSTVIAGGI